ncbi:DMT family transporter [Achromobacter deleyi]|uniref:DMT family transporter n=1 Tax=Achromobacter deleyi TaxID=1353891 RepID=A0A7T4E3R1_9BURK|nr:DMT family transporter [Achromobacter deleyi]QQB34369.1 DMT family transporter [Achromobacter deleyi]
MSAVAALAPPARRPLDSLATGVMLLLCVCWGFQQIAIKLVAADISPIMQVGLRSAFAALVLGVVVWRGEGSRALRDGTLGAGILVGLLFGFEFLAIAQGLVYTTASHMSVFLYTAPIFTALGLHWRVPEERMAPLQWLGVAVAFGGIAVAFLGNGQPQAAAAASNMLLGDALGLLGGLLWGATTVAIRRTALSEAAPSKTLFYQMAIAALVLLAYAAATGNAGIRYTPSAMLSVAFQSVVVALSSYLAWFWLLRRYLASRLSILSFMTPLFGVSFGVLILDEPLDGAFVIGALMVLAGISLVSGAGLLREKLRRGRRV